MNSGPHVRHTEQIQQSFTNRNSEKMICLTFMLLLNGKFPNLKQKAAVCWSSFRSTFVTKLSQWRR